MALLAKQEPQLSLHTSNSNSEMSCLDKHPEPTGNHERSSTNPPNECHQQAAGQIPLGWGDALSYSQLESDSRHQTVMALGGNPASNQTFDFVRLGPISDSNYRRLGNRAAPMSSPSFSDPGRSEQPGWLQNRIFDANNATVAIASN